MQTEQLSVNLRFNSDVTFSLVGGNGPVSLLGYTETVLGGLFDIGRILTLYAWKYGCISGY